MTYQPAQIAPSQTSEATKIEQSRAVAEVQAAVTVAQHSRRNKALAVAEMREAAAQKSVAARAFFRFPRAGQTVSGPSVHLARELARCWGNITYGVTELRRDDLKGESEMQAFAWDLETNARNATTFIVPHKRDTKKGVQHLEDMRDIYENNANNGARRLRECIFSVLPGWFIDEAQDICTKTLADGGGVPLAQRIADAIGAFDSIGVSRAQLEAKIGQPSDSWSGHDVAQLGVSFTSIQRGEVTKADEFPMQRSTTDEIKAVAKPAEPEPEPDTGAPYEPLSDEQGRALAAAFKAHKITALSRQIEFLAANQIADVEGLDQLTAAQAAVAIENLS